MSYSSTSISSHVIPAALRAVLSGSRSRDDQTPSEYRRVSATPSSDRFPTALGALLRSSRRPEEASADA